MVHSCLHLQKCRHWSGNDPRKSKNIVRMSESSRKRTHDGNPRVPKVCGARHTRARSRDHKKSETLLGQHSATVGTELCLSCNKWCSIRGWNYGTDSSFYASFLHFQCTSTHQRKRQRSKCVYWYFFTNNIPTIFK